MRTYAGHSSAAASNALFRKNLAKGQTGLSIAFDLPTQTGYDPDDELARGEVGKVGVPVTHLGDMHALVRRHPARRDEHVDDDQRHGDVAVVAYIAAAEEQGIDPTSLRGTTQNDIIKEYLSRGTYVFPPGPSLRLITDMITYTVTNVPKWNPINICSYHLQEAGATPVQELAYALSTAIAVLDAVRDSGQVPPERFGNVVQRISFFVNAGVRFVEEMCKMRAFVQLWDEITAERYGVTDPRQRRFRYGVQVNSLGLTEAQPENNVQRIVLEMLAVTLSKDARARAIQLPAWNEALGLPRPWDQQWSLRMQQVLAFESDLLEYGDLFDGSHVVEAKVDELVAGAREEMERIEAMGGAVAAVEIRLHEERTGAVARRAAPSDRVAATTSSSVSTASRPPSPTRFWPTWRRPSRPSTPMSRSGGRTTRGHGRSERDDEAVEKALQQLAQDAHTSANLMPASLACARAGVTTGEWAGTLRECLRRVPSADGRLRRDDMAAGRRSSAEAVRASRRHDSGRARWAPLRILVGQAWVSTATPTGPSRSRCVPVTLASRSCTRASG